MVVVGYVRSLNHFEVFELDFLACLGCEVGDEVSDCAAVDGESLEGVEVLDLVVDSCLEEALSCSDEVGVRTYEVCLAVKHDDSTVCVVGCCC